MFGIICVFLIVGGIGFYILGYVREEWPYKIAAGFWMIVALFAGLLLGPEVIISRHSAYAIPIGLPIAIIIVFCIIMVVVMVKIEKMKLLSVIGLVFGIVFFLFGGLFLGNAYPNGLPILLTNILNVFGLIIFPSAGMLVAYHEHELQKEIEKLQKQTNV